MYSFRRQIYVMSESYFIIAKYLPNSIYNIIIKKCLLTMHTESQNFTNALFYICIQVIQESLPIPGTDLHLVYHSSRAGGYLSTIQLQLTPDSIPKDLKLIHLRISIEGILFEKVFEADPAIKYTYAWNRRNVYRQKVYGVATATGKFHWLFLNTSKYHIGCTGEIFTF